MSAERVEVEWALAMAREVVQVEARVEVARHQMQEARSEARLARQRAAQLAHELIVALDDEGRDRSAALAAERHRTQTPYQTTTIAEDRRSWSEVLDAIDRDGRW